MSTKTWKTIIDQRQFFEKLQRNLNIKKWSDWKKVSRKDIIDNGGSSLLAYFGTLEKALLTVYPEHGVKTPKARKKVSIIYSFTNKDWPPKAIGGYWKVKTHQLNFLEKLYAHLKLTSWEDWHSVPKETIKKFGGSSLLKFYNGSFIKCLTTLYPEYSWKLWKFEKVPQEFWQDIQNRRLFFEDLAKKLNITSWENWYDVSSQTIRENGGSGLIEAFGAQAVVSSFPEYDWQLWKFNRVNQGTSFPIYLLY